MPNSIKRYKAFDYIYHALLIVKLAVYGFDNQSQNQSFFPVGNKEQIIMPLVVTLKFYMEFQKDRFRGLYLKISYSCDIFF